MPSRELGVKRYSRADWRGFLKDDSTIEVQGPFCPNDGTALNVFNADQRLTAAQLESIVPKGDDYFACPKCWERHRVSNSVEVYSTTLFGSILPFPTGTEWMSIAKIRQKVRDAFVDDLHDAGHRDTPSLPDVGRS